MAVGTGDDGTLAEASQSAGSFGLFVRSLVGRDQAAAKRAFAKILDDNRYSVNQIRMVEMVIDDLTENGTVEERRVYGSSSVSVTPEGPGAIFVSDDVDELLKS